MEKGKVEQSCPTLDRPWNFPGQNTGVGTLSLLQGIFPTRGLDPRLPQCRRILCQLSHQGSPAVERGLLVKEDLYCSGGPFLWEGESYSRTPLIPRGLLQAGRDSDSTENYCNKGN